MIICLQYLFQKEERFTYYLRCYSIYSWKWRQDMFRKSSSFHREENPRKSISWNLLVTPACLDVSTVGMNFCFLVSFIPFYAFLFLNSNTTRPFIRHLFSYRNSCSLRFSSHIDTSLSFYSYLHLICLCDMIVLSYNLFSFSLKYDCSLTVFSLNYS